MSEKEILNVFSTAINSSP